ncbi:MAG: DNA polymerase III subunit delta [Verrucomicrobiota bacterium]
MPAKKSQSAIHFVTGSDDAAVKKAALDLAAKLAPGADAFGLETIDGAVDLVDPSITRIRQTMQALSTLPFLGGTKLVWLKSASFLADTVAGRSEAVIAELEALCDLLEAGLPDGVAFLMSAPGADKRRSAYKRLSKAGETVVCDKPSLGFGAGEEEVIHWTAQQISKHGLKITPEAVEMLAARIGLDSGRLQVELEKLDTALGSGHEIVAEDIRALVPSTRESGIFDLGNAISARDLPLALETLGHLFYQGEKGVGILLASIVPTVRNLLLAKSLLIRHKLRPPAEPQFFARDLSRIPPDETTHLPKKKDGTLNTYGLGLAAKHSVHFTLEELRRAFQQCADANQRLISSQGSESVVLTRLLVGFLQRPA